MAPIRMLTPPGRFDAVDGEPDDDTATDGGDSPWLGTELPDPVTGCPTEPCEPGELTPVDIYCRTHERLIPFATDSPGRTRWLLVNAVRAVVCGAVLLAAHLNNVLPLFAVFVAAGAVVATLPLHRYPRSVRAALIGWLIVSVGALTMHYAGPEVDRWLRTIAVAAILIGSMIHLGRSVWFAGRDGISSAVGGAIAAMAICPAAVIGLLVWGQPNALFGEAPGWLRAVLVVTAVGAVTGSLLIAVICGAIDGQSAVDHRVDPPVRRPRIPRPVDWHVDTPGTDGSLPVGLPARLGAAAHRFGRRTRAATFAAASAVANLLRRAAHLLAVGAVHLINWAHRRIIMGSRRTRAALVACGAVLLAAAGIGGRAAGRTSRGVLVPAAMLVTAGGLAMVAADGMRGYLVSGTFDALATLAWAALVAMLTLSLVWGCLSGLPIRVATTSGLRTAGIAGPHALVVLAVGGWVVGLPGTFGYGPVHVGWVTGAATGLLLAAFAWSRWGHPSPAPTSIVAN